MAYDITNFTDYVGRQNEFLTATLFSGGDTGKFARYMTNVKGKESVPKIDGDATIQKKATDAYVTCHTSVLDSYIIRWG